MESAYSRMKSFLLLAAIVAMLLVPVGIGTAQSTTEKWEGVLDVKVATLKIQLLIEFDGDSYKSGKAISVDQGNAEMKFDSFERDADTVKFKLKSVGAEFSGKYSEDRQKLVGKFKQGQAFDMEFRRVEGEFAKSEYFESWKGTLDSGVQKFDFRLKFFKEQDGSISAKLDSINEGAMGMKVELDRDDEKCNFDLKAAGASYEGKFNETKDRIEGSWKQGGGTMELVFEKTELNAQEKLNRPQHPKKPYPYIEEEVTFENKDASITFSGTVTRPKEGGPFPALILISGSGPQDRDETIFGHKPFLVIADHLTRNSMAVLRFDERGVGESTGSFPGATSEDFANDVEAAIEYLKTRDEIAKDKIGMIGHSEGGMIAPMIAARRSDVSMIVLLAGPGVDGREIGISQSRAMAKASGAAEESLQEQEELMSAVIDEIAENGECSEEFVDSLVKDGPDSRTDVEALIARMNDPWFKYFLKYDPRDALKKVKCPVLVLNGKKDLQVLVDLNVDAIAKALKEGRNENFETHKLDNLNHLFQETTGPGLVTEYGRLEETFSPKALDIISDWLLKICKKSRG